MRTLQTLLMLLGALAVLTLGAAPAAAGGVAPGCHEAVEAHHGASTPAPDHDTRPAKAISTMSCCVACVAVAFPEPPAGSRVTPTVQRAAPPRAVLPGGLSPAPETGPPRV